MRRPLSIIQMLEKNQFNTGSVHQMFQAAVGLRERGHEVTIVSRPDERLARRAAEHEVRYEPLPLRHELDLRSIVGLRRLIRERGVDVIHVHKGLPHSIALAATLRSPVAAFVVNRGVSFPLTTWNRLKYTTRRVDRIVTVCQQIKDVVVSSGRVAEQKVTVVYAGVDLQEFDPALYRREEFRAEIGVPSDRFLVLQVGVRDWKGWKELIDAFSDLVVAVPNAHLALIACKDQLQKEMVRAYAGERGVAERVTPVEYRSDMARVLSSADVVVDASWAGTGITGTIREAMALGRPVIATDCGGNAELLSSSQVGWLVPMKDRGALVNALREVHRDPDQAARIGTNARQHVRNGFSKDVRIDRLEQIYRDIVLAKTV